MNAQLTKDDLSQFIGSEVVYRHNLMRTVTYTEGVQYLAEKGRAHWLIDKIATLQLEPKVRAEEFQAWKLVVTDKHRATLSCEDGNDHVVYQEKIDWTDFPLDEITLFYTDRVIMLPSEY